ncbi:LANO_0E02520g1_1 [Lachancea nothofagi CBS 11611]|uniref:ATPase inhibitor, mitochondrial n=1 Tax=Lachancea nothofagi CBS 11611 TaxID=1266666 RepID=A0A1G4JQ39_9SACH|nr:LANO_0E02520g1_1 [Lachancea nothofagi CBS 11611]
MLALSTRTTLTQSFKLRCGMASRFYSEGSVGSPRNNGSEDSFTKRERAQEEYYIRQHEKDQLAQLRKKVQEQEKKIEHLEDKINGSK